MDRTRPQSVDRERRGAGQLFPIQLHRGYAGLSGTSVERKGLIFQEVAGSLLVNAAS